LGCGRELGDAIRKGTEEVWNASRDISVTSTPLSGLGYTAEFKSTLKPGRLVPDETSTRFA